jgi:hypothetical protein
MGKDALALKAAFIGALLARAGRAVPLLVRASILPGCQSRHSEHYASDAQTANAVSEIVSALAIGASASTCHTFSRGKDVPTTN